MPTPEFKFGVSNLKVMNLEVIVAQQTLVNDDSQPTVDPWTVSTSTATAKSQAVDTEGRLASSG